MDRMKPWDGYDKYRTDWTRYNTDSEQWEYGIDDAGNVFYRQRDTGEWHVWCTAGELTRHLRHLENIKHPLTWTGNKEAVPA